MEADTARQRLQALMASAEARYEPRSSASDRAVRELADAMLEVADAADLDAFELERVAARDEALAPRLALKLARSKARIRALPEPVHISVVFGMYRERVRMQPRTDHEHGEDFLVRKVDQLDWLSAGGAPFRWELLAVDDGCPEASGEEAQRVLAERRPDAPARVLFLERAIAEGHPATRPMTSADDSQKGGAVALGMAVAAEESRPAHVIAYTDADVSTDLGQVGLLVAPILAGDAEVAIGSRRAPDSVVVKARYRDDRGRLFIYLWKSLLAPLRGITDTQCGFKAFAADTARELVADLREKRFAFDLELLLRAELQQADSIARVGIGWIDSEAESTTAGAQPYLAMLHTAAGLYRRHLPASPAAEAVAAFVEALTEEQWQRLTARIPPQIGACEPDQFDGTERVGLDVLRAAAGA